jgi:hypothetical protein
MATLAGKGQSGIYILTLPASRLTLGQPLKLTMRVPAKGGGWVMCHGIPNTLQTVQQQVRAPKDNLPAIEAFTPHKQGESGVTIGEFAVEMIRL